MTKIKSALVSAILMAVVSMSGYVIGLGDVYSIDSKVLINTGIISLLTALVSLIKSIGTTDGGKFAGIQVK